MKPDLGSVAIYLNQWRWRGQERRAKYFNSKAPFTRWCWDNNHKGFVEVWPLIYTAAEFWGNETTKVWEQTPEGNVLEMQDKPRLCKVNCELFTPADSIGGPPYSICAAEPLKLFCLLKQNRLLVQYFCCQQRRRDNMRPHNPAEGYQTTPHMQTEKWKSAEKDKDRHKLVTTTML